MRNALSTNEVNYRSTEHANEVSKPLLQRPLQPTSPVRFADSRRARCDKVTLGIVKME